MEKILLTLSDKMIAPRFDLATEVQIVSVDNNRAMNSPRSILLPGPSADELSGLILKEDIGVLICGGIEDEHYQFLSWKKVRVIDRVIGETRDVLDRFIAGSLRSGDIVKKKRRQGAGQDD